MRDGGFVGVGQADLRPGRCRQLLRVEEDPVTLLGVLICSSVFPEGLGDAEAVGAALGVAVGIVPVAPSTSARTIG